VQPEAQLPGVVGVGVGDVGDGSSEIWDDRSGMTTTPWLLRAFVDRSQRRSELASSTVIVGACVDRCVGEGRN
jgi:hypothetical protein